MLDAAREALAFTAGCSLGEPLRVAVLAAEGDLGAATHRIPGRVSPLDGASVAHRVVRITNTKLNPSLIFQANTKGSPQSEKRLSGPDVPGLSGRLLVLLRACEEIGP
jgi:hypothetical protein